MKCVEDTFSSTIWLILSLSFFTFDNTPWKSYFRNRCNLFSMLQLYSQGYRIDTRVQIPIGPVLPEVLGSVSILKWCTYTRKAVNRRFPAVPRVSTYIQPIWTANAQKSSQTSEFSRKCFFVDILTKKVKVWRINFRRKLQCDFLSWSVAE